MLTVGKTQEQQIVERKIATFSGGKISKAAIRCSVATGLSTAAAATISH
ncbi:MAG: hypothetical protein R3B90_13015 [Planctomycetaceae bacterium]